MPENTEEVKAVKAEEEKAEKAVKKAAPKKTAKAADSTKKAAPRKAAPAAKAARAPKAEKSAEASKMLKITLVKSTIGAVPKNKAIVKSMGFKKLNSSVILPDNAATRGQIRLIASMLKVEEL